MQRAVGIVAPGRGHAVGIARAHRLVVGVHHIVVAIGAGQPIIVHVVHRAVRVPGLALHDGRAIGPLLAHRLAVRVERIGCSPALAGDAVIDQLVQRAVGIVAPGRGHAVGIARAHRLVVGVDHVVIAIGAGQPVIVHVMHRAVRIPGLALHHGRAIGPLLAHRLAVRVKRVGRSLACAGNAVIDQLVQRAVGVVAPGCGHAVGIARAHRLVVGVDHVVVAIGAGQPIIVHVVHRAVRIPGLALDDGCAVGPLLAHRLAVRIERIGCGLALAGDAVIDELVQRAVGIVAPGRGHAVGIGRAHRLVVGVDHVVIAIGAGQPIIVHVVHRAVRIPGLALHHGRAIGPLLAHRLAVRIERIGCGIALADNSGNDNLMQGTIRIKRLGGYWPSDHGRIDLQPGKCGQGTREVRHVPADVGDARASWQVHLRDCERGHCRVSGTDRVAKDKSIGAGPRHVGRGATGVERQARGTRNCHCFAEVQGERDGIARELGARRGRRHSLSNLGSCSVDCNSQRGRCSAGISRNVCGRNRQVVDTVSERARGNAPSPCPVRCSCPDKGHPFVKLDRGVRLGRPADRLCLDVRYVVAGLSAIGRHVPYDGSDWSNSINL